MCWVGIDENECKKKDLLPSSPPPPPPPLLSLTPLPYGTLSLPIYFSALDLIWAPFLSLFNCLLCLLLLAS